MRVYLIKVVSRGQKNTRWQFADGYGSLFDGLLPTSGEYHVGQELDKDAFSSIRGVNNGQHCQANQNGIENSIDQILAIRDAEAAQASNYVNVLTGEVVAEDMTEAEFEAAMEMEF